jgi:hypothetical protein
MIISCIIVQVNNINSHMESKRKILYDTIEKSCIHFKHLNNKNKLIWLLNTDDNNILLELCKFLCLI